jgi:MFS transporter, FHS family, L-fucose permease
MNETTNRATRTLLYGVYGIYFFCGMVQCFENQFLPEFKDYFNLDYFQQQYVTFAKNIPFIFAVGIGMLIRYIGFKHCLSAAMALYSLGTLLLVPGLQSGHYWMVLAAFFVIGIGFNFQLVAGNPLLSGLGPASGAASRLNFGNALGAIAWMIAPATLTLIIPIAAVAARERLPYMQGLFLVLGVALVAITILTVVAKNVDISASFKTEEVVAKNLGAASDIWQHPKVIFGFVAIFLTLGAEAGLFSYFRNYLQDVATPRFRPHESQLMATVCFALFAGGRLLGSWLQKRIAPATTLAISLLAALALLATIILAHGWAAIVALTAIGFFISIYFPTLYALAIEGLGDLTAKASGLLSMGFLGCALMPLLQGWLANHIGLQRSFVASVAAYLFALFFTLKGRHWKSFRTQPA